MERLRPVVMGMDHHQSTPISFLKRGAERQRFLGHWAGSVSSRHRPRE